MPPFNSEISVPPLLLSKLLTAIKSGGDLKSLFGRGISARADTINCMFKFFVAEIGTTLGFVF